MEKVYTLIFLVGVIYTVVTFLIGGLFDIAHIGGHIDTNISGHGHFYFEPHIHIDGQGSTTSVTISPLKPIIIVAFITVLGGVGMLGTHLKFNAILVFIVAFLLALGVSSAIFKFMLVPLYLAQSTSSVYQEELIGITATVITPIIQNGFGTISYTVNGSKHDAPAQHIDKKAVLQGQNVKIKEIKDNVFYVDAVLEISE